MTKWVLRFLIGLMVLSAIGALQLLGLHPVARINSNPPELRIFVLLPDSIESESLLDEMDQAASDYGAELDLYFASTVAEQKQLLHIAASSSADAVLIYPFSENVDFSSEFLECQDKMPVVVIGHELNAGNYESFIGLGKDSARTALIGGISQLQRGSTLVIVNRTEDQMLEILYLEKGEHQNVAIDLTSDTLQQLAQAPPAGYFARKAETLAIDAAFSAELRQKMEEIFQDATIGMVFSFDPWFLALSASFVEKEKIDPAVVLMGYGETNDFARYLRADLVDAIVVSKVAYSGRVGVRYLRDLYRNLWVPSRLDSGMLLVTAENIDRIEASGS